MDKEAENDGKRPFLSTLPKTLEALCSMQGMPHDDTILHRLLDMIRELITCSDDGSMSGLFKFVETVKEKINDLNSSVVVLGLGVATHLWSLAPSDCLQHTLASLFDTVHSSPAADNSSVVAAYFNSLSSVADHPSGLEWLEKNDIHVEAALSTIQTAQSVFLLSAAEKFVITSMINSLEMNSTTISKVSLSSSIVLKTVQLLTVELTEMTKEKGGLFDHMLVSSHINTFHQSVAQIISSVSRSQVFCQWKAGDAHFANIIAHLACHHSSEKIQQSALQCIVNISAFMSDKIKEEFLDMQIVSPILKHFPDGGIERVFCVAAAFINYSQDSATSSLAMKKLQQLHRLPHNVMFGEHKYLAEFASLRDAVAVSLCNPKRFGRMISSILHSIKQTDNKEGLVRLLHTVTTTKDDDNWFSQLSLWPQGVGTVIMNNQKLMNSVLHVLQQDDCLEFSSEQCTAILTSLMRVMKRPLVESRLYSQVCSAFHSVLQRNNKHGVNDPKQGTTAIREVLAEWVPLMQYRLVSIQWEIKDTTLESIRKVIDIVSDPWLCHLMSESHLLRHAWSCAKYGESYPRASAIFLATSLMRLPDCWAIFLQDADVTEESLIDEVVTVLASDTEAFPRRAAVVFLTALFLPAAGSGSQCAEKSELRHKVCIAMMSALTDFDWEVKTKALEFWEKLAAPLLRGQPSAEGVSGVKVDSPQVISDKVLSRKRSATKDGTCEESEKEMFDILGNLLQDGFGNALLAGAEDYDSAVKQKALHMLQDIERLVKVDDHHSLVKLQKRDNDFTASHSDMESDTVSIKGEKAAKLDSSSHTNKISVLSVDMFLHRLSELNPSRALGQLGASTDEYDQKPCSLLEDVMAAVKMASTAHEVTLMSEDEFDDADDMFVDCY